MSQPTITRSAILMCIIVIASLTSWELYLRSKGARPSYDDGPPLWAHTRARVYEDPAKTVVFIGSSRIKYDLDIPTWEKRTGTNAIQLSCVGSSPMPTFIDLANDPNFKGRLVVDVTEILFFNSAPPFAERPTKGLNYYKDRTLAQRASFALNRIVESQFVFLDKDNYSLNAELDKLHVPNRPGIFAMPLFPMEFERTHFNRQSYMTDKFVADTNLHNRVMGIWDFLGEAMKGGPPPPPDAFDPVFATVKESVDKIRARGGDVIFLRTPSGGRYFFGENMGFPKEKFWDRLLAFTNSKGIHFLDYTALNHFVCPENSHLTPADAVLYTEGIISILQTEKGWKF